MFADVRSPRMTLARSALLAATVVMASFTLADELAEYREKIAKGDASALFETGRRHASGQGALRDPRQAVRWLRKSADQGYAPAQALLGEMYEAGQGAPGSVLEAFVLYSLAAEQENQEQIFGKAGAAELLAKRTRAEQSLTAEERLDAPRRIAAARALAAVHPRKFGAPGMIGKSRGWWVWKKWNPETWEAEVTTDPPGEIVKVRVLPWATTYRHLAYGARFDELLPGEKMNMFFDPDENHRRGYVVHFQDEISQMKGHGHAWQVREVSGAKNFVAQVYAGDKPLEDKSHAFEIDPACKKWSGGKLTDAFPIKPGDRLYMTWVYRDERRVVVLLADDASLETLKRLETERINKEVAAEGLAGQVEMIDEGQFQFMVYSTYWAQANQLKTGQAVQIVQTGPGYRPTISAAKAAVRATVLAQTNRGMYGSGVNDVKLKLLNSEDAARLSELEGRVLRLVPVTDD